MATEVRVKTIVLPGGKIEISTPHLIITSLLPNTTRASRLAS